MVLKLAAKNLKHTLRIKNWWDMEYTKIPSQLFFFQRNRENVPDFFLLELLGLIFFFIGTDGGEAWICYGKTESFLV